MAKIDALKNIKAYQLREDKSDFSEVVKRIAGLSDKPLSGLVKVPPKDVNILLGIDSVRRQQLVGDLSLIHI